MDTQAPVAIRNGAGLRLYEMAAELEAITDDLVESDGELTEDIERRLEIWPIAFERKVESCALAIRELRAEAQAAAAEAERLQRLARSRRNAAGRLADYVMSQMERAGVHTVDAPRARVRVQSNPRPVIRWSRDVGELPEAFRRVRMGLDAQAAHEAWRAGEELPDGFEVTRGRHLRIR